MSISIQKEPVHLPLENHNHDYMGIYDRNRLYVSDKEQQKIKTVKILLGGAGIGSVIAECALRFGFERITIVDGDKVELSNLNRQNYTHADIGKYKAEVLAKRLLKINPKAEISFRNEFIDKENIYEIIKGHDIAVNALDFQSDIPFEFDRICGEMGIHILHPYNFGWASLLTVIRPGGYQFNELSEEYEGFELRIAEFVVRNNSFWNIKQEWLKEVVNKYKMEKETLPPPQLSVGSWLVAGKCVDVMFNIINDRKVLYFPKFYLTSIHDA